MRIAFADVAASAFPIYFEFIDHATGEVLGDAEVAGPGALQVPNRETWGVPVGVRITYADNPKPEYQAPETATDGKVWL